MSIRGMYSSTNGYKSINTLFKLSRLVTSYLQIKDIDLYTRHCFRRASATLLANASVEKLYRRVSDQYIKMAKKNITGATATAAQNILLEVEPGESAKNQFPGTNQPIFKN